MAKDDEYIPIDPSLLHDRSGMVPYRVKDGDSIKSLADNLGMRWQDLAILNWGTCDPDEINWYLEHYVGCRKKTASGLNFVFTGTDVPGIMWLPRPLEFEQARVRRASARVCRYPIE